MTSSQPQIRQYPWFPNTEPPLGGGSQAGVWQANTRASLSTLAESLVYEGESSRINSLPSPWSRALQFQQAVLSVKYPTRQLLLDELFGALACLGLWDIFGLHLEAHRVPLRDLAEVNDEAVGPFARSLMIHPPDETLLLSKYPDGRGPWDVVYVFELERVVIGFNSPTTLFCPAVHLSSVVNGMGWTENGKFSSPVKYLNNQQQDALANWIDHVRLGLLQAPDRNNQSALGQMSTVLNGFIQQLSSTSQDSPTLSERALVQDLPGSPLSLSLLGRPAKGLPSVSMATIQLRDRLVKRKKLPLSVKPIILVDPLMPQKLNIPPAQINLYESATLGSIGLNPEQLKRQYGNLIEILTPEDFFLDELYLLPAKNAFTHSWLNSRLEGSPIVNGMDATPILPFKKRIRELFSSEEMKQKTLLRVIQDGPSAYLEVTFNLPLKGHLGGYPLSKSYPIKESNLLDKRLPVMALWPHFSDSKWNHYVLFCEDSSTGLTIEGFEDYDRPLSQDQDTRLRYFTTPNFPDVIRLSKGGVDCGLLPVEMPTKGSRNAVAWKVGIDFGTSFTNFFIDKGSGPEPIQLDTRLVSLTQSPPAVLDDLLNTFLIPLEMLPSPSSQPSDLDQQRIGNPPTATAVSVRGWQEVLGRVPKLFHEARLVVPNDEDMTWGPELRTGFKWEELQYQYPFLEELVLLISANALVSGASEILWSVSYPSAFSYTQKVTYSDLWSDLCASLTSNTGITHQLDTSRGDGGLQTEAVAFARFFRNFLDKNLVHTSCLDIGGGTTDISIWQENELVHQASIPFAGKDITTNLLGRRPSFVKILFDGAPLANRINHNAADARQDKNFMSSIDHIMRFCSAGVPSYLKIRTKPASPDQELINHFLSIMSVSYGGLFYYVGLVLKALGKEGKLQRDEPTEVYAGGNGARLISWIDESRRFRSGSPVDRMFGLLQAKALGVNYSRASTTLSESFKDETARGLISIGADLKGDFDPTTEYLISGAPLRINDLVYKDDSRIDTQKLFGVPITRYELLDIEAIKIFASAYDRCLSELRIRHLSPISKLCEESSFWLKVEREAASLCIEKFKKSSPVDGSDLIVEPGFITGLRALSNVLGSHWAERF